MSQQQLHKSTSNLSGQAQGQNYNQLQPQNTIQNLQHHPSLNSVNYQISQKHESQNQQNQQQLQRVNIYQNVINQDEILKMFAEQAKKQEKSKNQLQLKKRISKQKKLKEKEKEKEKASLYHNEITNNSQKQIKNNENSQMGIMSKLDVNSRKQLQRLMKEYKTQYHYSYFDNEVVKYRYQCKVALFLQLVVGTFQLSKLPSSQLSPQQQQLLNILQTENSKYQDFTVNMGIYRHCRKIAYQVDNNLYSYYQKRNAVINKQYKAQWGYLLNNIKDFENIELRRKVLTRSFSPQQIVKAQQIQFFTTEKKNQIKQKQAKFLAQFTAEDKFVPQQQNQEIIQRGRIQSFDFKAQMRQKKVNLSKYVDQVTLNLLQDLVSNDHLSKMKLRIQQDLREPILSKIMNNFRSQFRKQF